MSRTQPGRVREEDPVVLWHRKESTHWRDRRRLVCLKRRGCGVSVVMMLGLGGHVEGLSFTLREWRKPLQCLKQESEGMRGTVWKRDANFMEDELDRDKTAGGDI